MTTAQTQHDVAIRIYANTIQGIMRDAERKRDAGDRYAIESAADAIAALDKPVPPVAGGHVTEKELASLIYESGGLRVFGMVSGESDPRHHTWDEVDHERWFVTPPEIVNARAAARKIKTRFDAMARDLAASEARCERLGNAYLDLEDDFADVVTNNPLSRSKFKAECRRYLQLGDLPESEATP